MELPEDGCLTYNILDNFDISVLATSLTNTDNLITKMKEQFEENNKLKCKLQSLNESAIQLKNVYTIEKEKNEKTECENRNMQSRLSDLEEQLQTLQNKLINDTSINNQIVADLENRLKNQPEYTNLCKLFITQGNILYDNNLNTISLSRHYKTVKNFLKSKGECVEDQPKKHKKMFKSIAVMTDFTENESPAIILKQHKSTMHSQSTTTRGTSTTPFINTSSVGINFPEEISLKEIFEQTIIDVPDIITQINEFKWPTVESETQTKCKTLINCGTVTRIKNVRKNINYTRKIKQHLLQNSNNFWDVKKEEDSPIGSLNNIAFQLQKNPIINPQLYNLWHLLGQTIFSIVGNGRIFGNSLNGIEINNFNDIQHLIGELQNYNNINLLNNANTSDVEPSVSNINNDTLNSEDASSNNSDTCKTFMNMLDINNIDNVLNVAGEQVNCANLNEDSNLEEVKIISNISNDDILSAENDACISYLNTSNITGMDQSIRSTITDLESDNVQLNQISKSTIESSHKTISIVDPSMNISDNENQPSVTDETQTFHPISIVNNNPGLNIDEKLKCDQFEDSQPLCKENDKFYSPIKVADVYKKTYGEEKLNSVNSMSNSMIMENVVEKQSNTAVKIFDRDKLSNEPYRSDMVQCVDPISENNSETNNIDTSLNSSEIFKIPAIKPKRIVRKDKTNPSSHKYVNLEINRKLETRDLRLPMKHRKSDRKLNRLNLLNDLFGENYIANSRVVSPQSKSILKAKRKHEEFNLKSIAKHYKVPVLIEPIPDLVLPQKYNVHCSKREKSQCSMHSSLIVDSNVKASTNENFYSSTSSNSQLIDPFLENSEYMEVDVLNNDRSNVKSLDNSSYSPISLQNDNNDIENSENNVTNSINSDRISKISHSYSPLAPTLKDFYSDVNKATNKNIIDKNPKNSLTISTTCSSVLTANEGKYSKQNVDNITTISTDYSSYSPASPSCENLNKTELSTDVMKLLISDSNLTISTDNISYSSVSPSMEDTNICSSLNSRENIDIISISHKTIDDISYSPASPKNAEIDHSFVPKIIPLNTLINTNHQYLLQNLIDNIDPTIRHAFNVQTETYSESQVIAKLRRVVERYLISSYSESDLKICYNKLLRITERPKLLATCIFEVIETDDKPCITTFTPPCPALSETHHQMLILVKKIKKYIPSFEVHCISQLERYIFTLTTNKLTLSELMNLTRFYIGLTDEMISDVSKIRFFIFKIFYYHNFKSIPMVYVVLMAHSLVLPKFNIDRSDPLIDRDPLAITFQVILANTNYFTKNEKSAYKKKEMLYMLRTYYKLNMSNRPTYEELISYLLLQLKSNKLRNISYSLILIAKRNGFEWASANIIQLHLIPLLKEYINNIELTRENDDKIAKIVFTIGSIVKTKPVTEDIEEYYQLFINVLEATSRQIIQESAVAALMQTSRFGLLNVYQRLCKWQPNFEISHRLRCVLNTFLHKKKKNFWK